MLQQNLHSVRFRSWFELLPVLLLLTPLLLSRCVLSATVADSKHTRLSLPIAPRTQPMEQYLDMLLASPDTIPSPPESWEDSTAFQSAKAPLRIQSDKKQHKWDVDEDSESSKQHSTSIENWSPKTTTLPLNTQRTVPNDRHGNRKRKLKSIPSAMSEAIAQGLKMAIEECKHQFRNEHWNCPTLEGKKGKAMFGQLLDKGESEFVLSLSFALFFYLFIDCPLHPTNSNLYWMSTWDLVSAHSLIGV